MSNKFCTLALTGLLTVGLAGGAAFAQDQTAPPPDAAAAPAQGTAMQGPPRQGHRMDPDSQLKHMTKQLDLSADQQTQIKPILADRQQQMQSLWQDQSLSKQDRRTKMMGIQQDSNSKIEGVLNDTQKQKYETMQAQMRERGMQRHQGAAAPAQDSSAPPAPQQ
jgi:hypothetical protein